MDILDILLGGVFGAFLALLIVIGGVAYVTREDRKAAARVEGPYQKDTQY